MRGALLITSKYSSANTKVGIDIAKACLNKTLSIFCVGRGTKNTIIPVNGNREILFFSVFSLAYKVMVDSRLQNIKGYVAKVINFFYSRFCNLFANQFCLYEERHIYKKCEEIIKNNDVECVFSISNPFYSHRIAYKLTCKFPHIKWIPLWLDAYSNARLTNNSFIYKKQLSFERYILEKSDNIYCLPETFTRNILFDKYADKIKTIGLPYILNRNVSTKNKHIIYAGSFVKGLRDPEPLLDLLLGIVSTIDESIRFHFYVPDPDSYREYEVRSIGRICFHHYVSTECLQVLLSECFMLLVVGNRNSVQVPSKVIEYIGYRKPILFFYYNSEDPSFDYLIHYSDLCSVCLTSNNASDIKQLLYFLKKQHKSISYDDLMEEDVFRENTPEYIKSTIKI